MDALARPENAYKVASLARIRRDIAFDNNVGKRPMDKRLKSKLAIIAAFGLVDLHSALTPIQPAESQSSHRDKDRIAKAKAKRARRTAKRIKAERQE